MQGCYEDRVNRRKEEIKSFQEALRILNGEGIASETRLSTGHPEQWGASAETILRRCKGSMKIA